MHLSDLVGLSGVALATEQEKIMREFLLRGADVGFGALQPVHVFGALKIVKMDADERGLKTWCPQLEHVQDIVRKMRGVRDDDPYDTLTRQETMEIVAAAWHAWGVLEPASANYGEHLVVLAMYVPRAGDHDAAVRSLPYMEDWIAAAQDSHFEAPNDVDARYEAWLRVLEAEVQDAMSSRASSRSRDGRADRRTLVQKAERRLARAKARSGAWMVDWFRSSVVYEGLEGPYNAFQTVYMLSGRGL